MLSKWTTKLPKIILAFIASLALVATGALLALRMTVFSQNFMIDQTEKSSYAQATAKEINEYIHDYGRGSNLPPEVLGEVVTTSSVQTNLNTFIRAIYTDLPFRLTGEKEMRQTLTNKIDTYIQQKNLTVDETTKKNVEDFITNSMKVFSDYVSIPSFRNYAKQVMAYDSKLVMLISVSGVFCGLLLIGLWVISGKYTHKRIRTLSYPIGGAGLMMIVLPALVLASKGIGRVAIQSKALYDFVTTYLTSIFVTVITMGGILVGCACVLMIVSEIMRRRVRRGG